MLAVMTTAVGYRLEQLREQRGLKLGQLASYSGVSRQWIRAVEVGEIETPGGDKLDRVAEALKTTSHYLLTGQGEPPKNDPVENALTHLRRFPPAVLERLVQIGDVLFYRDSNEESGNGGTEDETPNDHDSQASGI